MGEVIHRLPADVVALLEDALESAHMTNANFDGSGGSEPSTEVIAAMETAKAEE